MAAAAGPVPTDSSSPGTRDPELPGSAGPLGGCAAGGTAGTLGSSARWLWSLLSSPCTATENPGVLPQWHQVAGGNPGESQEAAEGGTEERPAVWSCPRLRGPGPVGEGRSPAPCPRGPTRLPPAAAQEGGCPPQSLLLDRAPLLPQVREQCLAPPTRAGPPPVAARGTLSCRQPCSGPALPRPAGGLGGGGPPGPQFPYLSKTRASRRAQSKSGSPLEAEAQVPRGQQQGWPVCKVTCP